MHTRRAPTAVATLRRALGLAPADALLHCDLGNALSACGEIEAALASWRHACGLDPAQPVPWFNLGRNLQQLGRTDEAIDALREAPWEQVVGGLPPAQRGPVAGWLQSLGFGPDTAASGADLHLDQH